MPMYATPMNIKGLHFCNLFFVGVPISDESCIMGGLLFVSWLKTGKNPKDL